MVWGGRIFSDRHPTCAIRSTVLAAVAQPLGPAEAFLDSRSNGVRMTNARELARIRGFSVSVVRVLNWDTSVSMLGRALGADHTVALAIAASAAASELPFDFAKTMDRWMVSEETERSPLSFHAPKSSTDLYAAVAALAGTLDRSGEHVCTMGAGSRESSRPRGLSTVEAACLWLAMRSLSLEISLPLFDTIWAGAPRSLDMSQPSESCVTALLVLGDSERDTHGQSPPRSAVVVASASSVRCLVSNSRSVDFIVERVLLGMSGC